MNDDDGDGGDGRENITGTLVLAVVLCMLNLAWLWYYFGVVWSFTRGFQHEFTQWFTPPAPGPLVDQRFNFQWMCLAPLVFNVFPPLVALWIMLKPTAWWRYDLHRICLAVAVVITGASLTYFVVWVWVWQNGSSLFPFSIANSVNDCCKYFGAYAASHHCHNLVECVDLPTVPTIRLHTDEYFEQHILVGMPGCLVFAGAQLFVASMMRTYVAVDQYTDKKLLPKQRALHAVNALYVILVCVYAAFGLLILQIRYTHQFPPTGPVGIISAARHGIEAVGLVMSGGVVVVPGLVLLVMLLAKNGQRLGVLIVFGLIALLTLTHFFAFVTMMHSRGTANQPGYANSYANHPMRCCAGDVAAHPLSQCDNPAAVCVYPVAAFPSFRAPLSSHDIPSNATHTLIFALMFLFLVLDGVILGLVYVTFIGERTKAAVMATIGQWMIFQPAAQPMRRSGGGDGGGPSLLPMAKSIPSFLGRVFAAPPPPKSD
jgi:hypothetical protein